MQSPGLLWLAPTIVSNVDVLSMADLLRATVIPTTVFKHDLRPLMTLRLYG